jgi:hypothetical protein
MGNVAKKADREGKGIQTGQGGAAGCAALSRGKGGKK